MSSLNNKLTKIEKIATCFNKNRKEYDDSKNHIVDILKSLINKYASQFDLTKKNSVREVQFYSIVSRTKEVESFKEKLVRNNLFNNFEEVLNKQNYSDPNIKKVIMELDDIIGVKILTDINKDTVNMFNLITSQDFVNDAMGEDIELNSGDLREQPVKMKNGLDIYKVRGKYKSYNFELQLKSKLLSSWGDMEHSIFYKDYQLTPVRDIAQQAMNHIGKLLKQIDEFLENIRGANDNYTSNSKALLFISSFEIDYSEQVSKILNGIGYNFQTIASILYNIKESSDIVFNKKNKLKIKHFTFSSAKYKDYIKLRNSDFDLQILESIILSNIKSKISITDKNLDLVLDNYFSKIINSYIHFIVSNKYLEDTDLAKRYVELVLSSCIENNCKNYLVNTISILKHIQELKRLEDLIDSLDLEMPKQENILMLYTILMFQGDINDFVEKNETDKDEIIEILENCKTEIQKTVNSDKLTESFATIINKLN